MNLPPVLQTDSYRTWVWLLLLRTDMSCSRLLCMGTEPSRWKRLETRSVIVTLPSANSSAQPEECDARFWNAACVIQKVCPSHHSLPTPACRARTRPGYHQARGSDAQGLRGSSFSGISFNAAPSSASWPAQTRSVARFLGGIIKHKHTHRHAHTHTGANEGSGTPIATIFQKAS